MGAAEHEKKMAGALEFFLLARRGGISEDLSVNIVLVYIRASVISFLKLMIISNEQRDSS